MKERPITVVLTDAGVAELGGILKFWFKDNPALGFCGNCKSVNPEGHYFQMVIEEKSGSKTVDIEFNVHHHYIKAFLHAPALKKLGFTA